MAKSFPAILPWNYQYELSSAIYKIIERGNKGFADFLHEQGYVDGNKKFKLFTFSGIKPNIKPQLIQSGIKLLSPDAHFEVSFVVPSAAQEFIKGLFQDQHMELVASNQKIQLYITQLEAMKEPDYKETMNYRALSPVFIKKMRPNKEGSEHLSPDHPEYGQLLYLNLLDKLQAAHLELTSKEITEAQEAPFSWKTTSEPKQKNIRIKQNTPEYSDNISYLYDMEISAHPLLHRMAYLAGIGMVNSQGFGCVGEKEKIF